MDGFWYVVRAFSACALFSFHAGWLPSWAPCMTFSSPSPSSLLLRLDTSRAAGCVVSGICGFVRPALRWRYIAEAFPTNFVLDSSLRGACSLAGVDSRRPLSLVSPGSDRYLVPGGPFKTVATLSDPQARLSLVRGTRFLCGAQLVELGCVQWRVSEVLGVERCGWGISDPNRYVPAFFSTRSPAFPYSRAPWSLRKCRSPARSRLCVSS